MYNNNEDIKDVFPMEENGRKVCSKCGWEKDVSEFGQNSCKADGLNTWCNECKSKYFRIHYRIKKYNIPDDEFQQMLIDQNYRCASCGDSLCEVRNELHHKHNTKPIYVYGILCYRCNHLIGYVHDDFRILLKVAVYQASKEGVDIAGLRKILKHEF